MLRATVECSFCCLYKYIGDQLTRQIMIPFPNISPEIFSIDIFGFELTLRWYSLSYIAGFVIAFQIMKKFASSPDLWAEMKSPLLDRQLDSLMTYLILSVILGGRIGYVFFYNFGYYAANPLSILRLWDGGMSFHGGFIGVVIAVITFAYINKISLWSLADLVAVASPPGIMLGRLANFINAELWGKPTDLPWGVIFPGEAAQSCNKVIGECARHPSQLYEAFLEGLLLFVLMIFLTRFGVFKLKGFLTGLFLIGYGASRFLVEFFAFLIHSFFQIII